MTDTLRNAMNHPMNPMVSSRTNINEMLKFFV